MLWNTCAYKRLPRQHVVEMNGLYASCAIATAAAASTMAAGAFLLDKRIKDVRNECIQQNNDRITQLEENVNAHTVEVIEKVSNQCKKQNEGIEQLWQRCSNASTFSQEAANAAEGAASRARRSEQRCAKSEKKLEQAVANLSDEFIKAFTDYVKKDEAAGDIDEEQGKVAPVAETIKSREGE